MDDSDQQAEVFEPGQTSSSTDAGTARTAGGKPKTKEVKARYLQNKPTPAAQRPAAGTTGRPSLAAYHSAGWIELQLPNHASTPLMMHTGGTSSAVFTQTSKGRRVQPTPAPSTLQRPPRHTAQQQRRQQQQQQYKPDPSRLAQLSSAQQATPGAGAAATAATPTPQAVSQRQQQQQQHDVAPQPDTARRTSSIGIPQLQPPASGALISPGSSRSSTSCSFRHGPDMDPDMMPLHARQHHAAEQQTPLVGRMAASLGGPGTGMRLARLGMSADMAALHGPGRTADRGAAQRRAALEEYRHRKMQQQLGVKGSARNTQGGFKEPQPKTMFKATAASMWGAKAMPLSSAFTRGAAAGSAAVPAAGASAASTPAASPSPAAAAAVPSGSPASAFKATMATLQQTGSGSKPSRPLSSSRPGSSSGGKQQRPIGVPALQMDWLQQGQATACATPPRPPMQQQLGRSPLPATATKIPSLDLSSVGKQQQHKGVSVPLSSRQVASAAHVPLPDATPRTFRDAPPSRLPKTPRASTSHGAEDAAAPQASPPAAAARAAVPSLKLSGLPGVGSSTAAGSGSLSSRLAAAGPGKTPRVTSARATTASRAAATPPGAGSRAVAHPAEQPAELGQPSRTTPRGLIGSGTGFVAAPPTPRSCVASSVSGAGPAAAKKGEERAQEVRQQLRLLHTQHLQLRHLNARVEAAVQAKKEKAEAAIAAAAVAVIDLSAELTALKGHQQQEQWRSELDQVLQRQLPKLRKWAELQAQHRSNVSQLQAACSAALSHVPLLNGATVGHHPEQPDLDLLQRQLVHGMQLLQEVQPALQQLLGPDLGAISSSSSSQGAAADSSAAGTSAVQLGQGSSQAAQKHQAHCTLHAQNSIRTTAALAEQLMGVAGEECGLLNQLAQQLAQLSDLHLYANSMQVQLVQMKQASQA